MNNLFERVITFIDMNFIRPEDAKEARNLMQLQAKLKATTWCLNAVSKVERCSCACPNLATHDRLCYPHSLSTHAPKMNWKK